MRSIHTKSRDSINNTQFLTSNSSTINNFEINNIYRRKSANSNQLSLSILPAPAPAQQQDTPPQQQQQQTTNIKDDILDIIQNMFSYHKEEIHNNLFSSIINKISETNNEINRDYSDNNIEEQLINEKINNLNLKIEKEKIKIDKMDFEIMKEEIFQRVKDEILKNPLKQF